MRILLFDIDGTLLLTNRGGKEALEIALSDAFGIDNPCVNIPFAGRTDRSLLSELLQRNGISDDETNLIRLRDHYVDTLPAVLDRRGGRVLPGVPQLLRKLARCPDLVCCVMTGNFQVTATRKLEHFDLRQCVRDIFGGDSDVDRNDLARRSADQIRKKYGESSLRDTIVIGDTPADVRCGHAIGARVLAVCTGGHDRESLESENPARVEEDLSDVDRLYRWLIPA